jgi:hypothetical protein
MLLLLILPYLHLHGQLQFKNKKIIAGLGAEYQSLKPVIESGGLASDEKLNSTTVFGYFKYSDDDIITKFYGISGGNLTHLVMLGGYGSYANSNGIDSYKPTRTTAFWVDIASNKPKIAPGFLLVILKTMVYQTLATKHFI